jgi:hypothetical protein
MARSNAGAERGASSVKAAQYDHGDTPSTAFPHLGRFCQQVMEFGPRGMFSRWGRRA